MRIIGYARVSKLEQANDSNALTQQVERLKNAGAEEIFVDVQSGWKDVKRPNLEKVIELVQSCQVDKVIVTRLDRISRRGLKSLEIFQIFLDSGVILQALDEPFDLTTAAGRAMASQLVVFAQFHSDQKAESVRHGWEHLRKRKVAMNPPFGYAKVENKHQLDYSPFLCLLDSQQEMSRAQIARDTVEIFLEVKSLRGTVRAINAKYGIQHFNHTGSKTGFTAGGLFQWSTSGLSQWLTNPVLCGHLIYLRDDKKRTKITYNTHPDQRLISDDELREINEIIEYNRKTRGYGFQAPKYPLSGLVYCKNCGGNCYSSHGGGRKYYYYQCKNARVASCDNKKLVRMEKIEKVVIDALVKKAEAIAIIAQQPDQLQHQKSPEILKLESQIDQLQQLNSISPNPAIKQAIDDIQEQITILLLQNQNQENTTVPRELLLWAFSDPECWNGCSESDKRRIFHELVNRIEIMNGEIMNVNLKI